MTRTEAVIEHLRAAASDARFAIDAARTTEDRDALRGVLRRIYAEIATCNAVVNREQGRAG